MLRRFADAAKFTRQHSRGNNASSVIPVRRATAQIHFSTVEGNGGKISHDRVRTDRVDPTGVVTLRVHSKLHHIGIGIGRTLAGTHVKILAHDLDVTIINAITGEILRQLTIDATKDYQPTGKPPRPHPHKK
ncbi:MAG: hypothetical protein V4531_06830 [Actinomycetota bacterium]